jgi:uncharacterized phage protein gp47/JayE
MSALSKRIDALESAGADGLTLVLISWIPRGGRETATCEGVTYTQDSAESAETFRARLATNMANGKERFLWVSELDRTL